MAILYTIFCAIGFYELLSLLKSPRVTTTSVLSETKQNTRLQIWFEKHRRDIALCLLSVPTGILAVGAFVANGETFLEIFDTNLATIIGISSIFSIVAGIMISNPDLRESKRAFFIIIGIPIGLSIGIGVFTYLGNQSSTDLMSYSEATEMIQEWKEEDTLPLFSGLIVNQRQSAFHLKKIKAPKGTEDFKSLLFLTEDLFNQKDLSFRNQGYKSYKRQAHRDGSKVLRISGLWIKTKSATQEPPTGTTTDESLTENLCF